MPSPEVIDLTLSDDEIQPDPIRSDQGTSTPTRATNWFRTSSSTPPTSGIIFERLLPTPFPQVGDILSEEEDSESEQELIA